MAGWMTEIKRRLRRNAELRVVVLLSVAAFGLMFVSSKQPLFDFLADTRVAEISYALNSPNEIWFNLCVGYLVTAFFWWMVVYRPDQRRRANLKRNFQAFYLGWKDDVLGLHLRAGNFRVPDSTKLLHHEQFSQFFRQNDRWGAVLGGMQDDPNMLAALGNKIDTLHTEVQHVLSAIPLEDAQSHAVLRRLLRQMSRLRADPVYIHAPAMGYGKFFYERFAFWSMMDGQSTEDYVQSFVDSL